MATPGRRSSRAGSMAAAANAATAVGLMRRAQDGRRSIAAGSPSNWFRKERSDLGNQKRKSKYNLAESIKKLGDTRDSLTSDLDASDQKAMEVMLKDEELKDQLERLWFCALDHGDYLLHNRMDMKLLRAFAKQTGLVTDPKVDRRKAEQDATCIMTTANIVMNQDEYLDMGRFVRALCHIAFYKYPALDNLHTEAITLLMKDKMLPWMEQMRARNQNDGMQPGDELFHPLDVDRLLYIYDTPLTRMFDRYRSLDQHVSRALSFEQMKMLDEVVELTELRDFCKDFGLFPKIVSYVEISKLAQLSCFGRVVVDPSKQSSTTDGVPDGKNSKRKSGMLSRRGSLANLLDETAVQPEEFMGQNTDIGLGVEKITDEDVLEVMLDKTMFMDVIMRLAQLIYTRTESDRKELPSIASRIEALMRFFAPYYSKIFGREMHDECDWVPKGLPVLKSSGENVACSPSKGPASGGYDIAIDGHNFCTKRGVYVRFHDPTGRVRQTIVLKAHTTRPKRVVVTAPAVDPIDIYINVKYDLHNRVWAVEISRVALMVVECSNDRHNYTSTEPLQHFAFTDDFPTWYLEEEMTSKLQKLFIHTVSYKDRRNTRYMTRDKWRQFKKEYQVVEQILRVPVKGQSATKFTDIEEPFFREIEQQQILPPLVGRDGESGMGATRNEPVIDFKGFIHILARCFCEYREFSCDHTKFDPMRPLECIRQLIEDAGSIEDRKVEVDFEDIMTDIAAAREQIKNIERKTTRELDVYCGPVLCASVADRPGNITIASQGGSAKVKRKHKVLTCTIYDSNVEGILMTHLDVANTFDHLFSRLTCSGFDFAAAAPPSTRRPTGRCWHVVDSQGVKIGALWDYPGQFTNRVWQPQRLDATNSSVTLSLDKGDEEIDYIVCFMLYMKADSIASLRKLLVSRGYTVRTALYRISM